MKIHNIFHINTSSNMPLCISTNIRRNISMKIHRKKIIKLIQKETVVTSSEVAEFFEVSWNTAEKYLMELLIEGKVARIKKVGVNLWLLK